MLIPSCRSVPEGSTRFTQSLISLALGGQTTLSSQAYYKKAFIRLVFKFLSFHSGIHFFFSRRPVDAPSGRAFLHVLQPPRHSFSYLRNLPCLMFSMNTNTDAPVYDKAVFTYNGNFYQHGSAAEHATQGAHPSSFTQTTSAQFTPHEPQAYQASGAIDDLTSHNSIDNLDAARGEMVRLFEGASPTTQNFVLHFLRKSTGNIQNRGMWISESTLMDSLY